MPDFAIHDGSTVVNVIVADSVEIAEQVTGMSAFQMVNGLPGIGWTLVDGVWIDPTAPKPEAEAE